MIETLGQTFCRECGKSIALPARQGPHMREFCNGTCRKRWHRKHPQAQPTRSNATIDTIEAQARIASLEAELELTRQGRDQVQERFRQYVAMTNEKISSHASTRIAELERELAEAHQLIDEYINWKRTPPEWKKTLQERFWQLGKAADHPPLSVSVPVPAGERAYRVFGLAASNELLEWASVALRNRDIVTRGS